MNVRELIEELKYMDPDAEVCLTYNYGDHWRTIVAPTVNSVEMGSVEYSEYHQMDKVSQDDYEDDDREESGETPKQVVLLG
jgi:hypothetical protein